MKNSFIISILILSTGFSQPALAGWGKFTMTDDNGEQVVVKHGLFGKKTIVKDRFGNEFENSKSIFGLTKTTQVGVLGNDVRVHKGLFGFSKTEGQDMLGDTVTSKKNLLYRNTNVNLSGVNGLLSKYFGPKSNYSPPIDPNAMVNQAKPIEPIAPFQPNIPSSNLAPPPMGTPVGQPGVQ